MTKIFTKLFAVCAMCFLTNSVFAKIIYVNVANGAAAVKDGATWATAYVDLQDALSDATLVSEDQIWVAKGVYKPSVAPAGLTISSGNMDYTFLIPEGVAIYGGFLGNETGLDGAIIARDFVANETILTGDLSGNDNESDLSTKVDNVFHVVTVVAHATNTFKLDGFTVQNGHATGSNLTQVNTSNYYSFYGAGIFLREAGGVLKNVVLKNNIVNANTATSVAYAGGLFIAGTKGVNLENVTFSENKCLNEGAAGAHAGALYTASTTAVKNAVFKKNNAKSNGGAVYLAGGGNTNFENADFEENTASSSGGAVYILGSSAVNKNTSSFTGGNFTNNEVLGTSATTGNGGAIYLGGYSAPNFEDVDFEDNIANYAGGAIYSLGNSAGQSSITITGGSFARNKANGYRAGAIYVSNYTNLVANTVIFSENEASGHGGAIFSIGGASGNMNVTAITDCSFINNIADVATTANGGAVHINIYSEATINNTLFTGNKALNGSAGALYVAGNSAANLSKLTVDGATFIDNVATANGGAININTNTETLLKNIFAQGNIADAAGGAIFTTGTAGGSRVIKNAVFYNNEAKTTLGGGAISISAATADIIGATFYANKATATALGGAINISSSASSKVSVVNSILYGNTSNVSGNDIGKGALATLDLKHSLTQEIGTNGVDGVVVGQDPQFLSVDPNNTTQFLRLSPLSNSFTVDKGLNSSADLLTDLAGEARIHNGTVDMGAYENLSALPIKLLDFNAKIKNNTIQVNWLTETETNNDYFLLERSNDGMNYSLLTKMLSKGNAGFSYTYTDYSPLVGTSYYRLTQVDKDGTKVTFDPKAVNLSLENQVSASIYPNPAIGGKITIELTRNNFTKLELVNLQGQVIKTLSIGTAELEKALDISSYASGIYFVRLSNGVKVLNKKIVKP